MSEPVQPSSRGGSASEARIWVSEISKMEDQMEETGNCEQEDAHDFSTPECSLVWSFSSELSEK